MPTPNINEYGYQGCLFAGSDYTVFERLPNGTTEAHIDLNQGVGAPNYFATPIGAFCCTFLNEIQDVNSPSYNPTSPIFPNVVGHTYTWDADRQECRWLQYVDCDDLPPFSVVLNPDGNEGVLFEVQPEETCVLEVSFEYMFKFDCQDIYDVQDNSVSDDLTALYNDLDAYTNDCLTTQSLLDNIQGGFNYVLPYDPNNTGYIYYCVSVAGLVLLEELMGQFIGVNAWTDYLNGDLHPTTIATNFPQVVEEMIIANDANQGLYLSICETGADLIDETYTYIGLYNQYTEDLEICNNGIVTTQDAINLLLNQNAQTCIYTIDTMEELIVNMAIDIQDPNQTNVVNTLYTEEIFNVGEGNLVNYLIKNSRNPIYIENYNWITCDNTICNSLANILTQQMIDQANEDELLSGDTFYSQYNQLQTLVGTDAFGANWQTFTTTITDQAIISGITGQLINLSLQVADSCVDFSILIDKIEMNKVCERVTNTETFISKNPSFKIRKVSDNKKSWVVNTTPESRNYTLPLRETEYNVNDGRLVLNTKEVDLNLSIANGIETDIWCYVNDNPCILEPCTTSTYTGITDCCCGETPLSGTNITGGTVVLPPASVIEPCERVVGGQGPAGGIVYWVNPNDPCEGYEVLPVDLSGGTYTWSDLPTNVIGGTSTDFGTGQANTNTILGYPHPPATPAATASDNLVYGGYSDWFLPSKDDLVMIATNTNTLTEGGGEMGYWSSSEVDSDNAWGLIGGVVSSSPSSPAGIKKTWSTTTAGDPYDMYVRPVRYFNTNPCNEIYSAMTAATVNNGIGEEYTECSWIYKFNNSVTPDIDFNGYWLAGMNDGQVGVFQQITTSGGTGTTVDYTVVTSKDCCEAYNDLIQDYAWSTAKGEYYTKFKWDENCEQCKFVKCAKPQCVDFTELLTSPLTGLTTIKQFNEIVSNELINVRCRKTSSSYPILRALYERYMNSTDYCESQSSQFDYTTMMDFSGLVGDYWVDLIEQVIPSTTIWCANHIYGNTLYDQQKFKYRAYSLFPCTFWDDPAEFPLERTATGTTDVDLYTIGADSVCIAKESCQNVYYVTGDCGSEFLGKITDSINVSTN